METNSKSKITFVLPCVKCATLNRIEGTFDVQAVEPEKKEDASPQEGQSGSQPEGSDAGRQLSAKVEAPKEAKADGKEQAEGGKNKAVQEETDKSVGNAGNQASDTQNDKTEPKGVKVDGKGKAKRGKSKSVRPDSAEGEAAKSGATTESIDSRPIPEDNETGKGEAK